MNTTHPRLASILPAIAAAIDIARPMLSRFFADDITVEIQSPEDPDGKGLVRFHCADQASSDFLHIPTQFDGVKDAFRTNGFVAYGFEINPPASTTPPSPPPPAAQSSTKRTANALTFLERDALRQWMQQPENTHLVAHESDPTAAAKATTALALNNITITPANIASMRRLLGIEKIKPEKPHPFQLPDGLTLADLQAQVNILRERIDHNTAEIESFRVQGQGTQATLADLHRVLTDVVHHLNTVVTPLDRVPGPAPLPTSQSGPSGQ